MGVICLQCTRAVLTQWMRNFSKEQDEAKCIKNNFEFIVSPASAWICINPILILVYPLKWVWPDLPHFASNISNSHSPSHSIHGIHLLQTNTLALFLHLRLPRLLWSSLLPLVLHFKLQCFSQNMPIIPPQHMPVPSHSIHLCHRNYLK